MRIERELMRGAGPLAVLKLLEKREMYGYELAAALAQRTEGLLAMGQSTLYPMLYNLQAKGLIAARADTAGPRPRKYYRLTAKGKKRLAADMGKWQSVVQALAHLGVAPAPGIARAPGSPPGITSAIRIGAKASPAGGRA